MISTKVFHLSYSDIDGGAARAAYRIHHALRSSGADSQMLVNTASSGDSTVQGPRNKMAIPLNFIRPHLTRPLCKLMRTTNPIIHSLALLPSRWPQKINACDAELVHLHWIQNEMLSISDIARIRKPIVWSLHDMWAFCGAEHLSWDNRWRDGYRYNNRPLHESGFDINRHTWQRKRRHWCRPLHIVCPSQWLADCVRSSALMHDWPVAVVPNPINTDLWQPIEQRLARQLLGLPQDCPLLLFGASGGVSHYHKGFDLLLDAIAHLKNDQKMQNLQLVVFGQLAPPLLPNATFPIHFIGRLHDDLSLRVLYSASDAMVIPSRQDNLPNTGLEAHACGIPVVAFNTCGLPDIVDDGVTGALAEPFDPASLASSISWVLEDEQRRLAMGAAARERAERLWNFPRIAGMYAEVYGNALHRYHGSLQHA